MKKNLGVVQAVYPMPVLIVAAYDETFAFAVFILLLIVARTFSNAELVADDTADQAAEAVDRMDEATEETVAFAALILCEI